MDLLKLEQQRQILEDSLKQLRGSLKQWQTWEAEYEGLKEETRSLEGNDASSILSISKKYGGELVNEKEIRDITGLDKASPRSVPQILGVIERRQEYVQKNIETIQRQYWDAEAKLEELDFAAISAHREAKGLPLTEIHEELDDDDNVISSSLSQPENSTAKIVDSLKAAGLSEKDLAGIRSRDRAASVAGAAPPSSEEAITSNAIISEKEGDAESSFDENDPKRPPTRKKSVSFSADTKPPPEPVRVDSEDGKKSVSFAPKVAVMPAADPPDTRSVSFDPVIEEIPASQPAEVTADAKPNAVVQKDLRASFKPGEKVIELDDDGHVAGTHIVLPEDESEEDARMRREMLDYHLHEVGHVVAQIDLDEEDEDGGWDDATTASDFTSERPDEDTPYTSGMSDSSEEDEDEYGRTKKRVISDAYHNKMQELSRRLIGNLGPAPTDQDLKGMDPEIDPKDVRKLVIRGKCSSTASNASSDDDKKTSSKKRVSFAESIDVADPGSPPSKALKTREGENVAPPLTEGVPERGASHVNTSHMDLDVPSGPPGMVIADELKERAPQLAGTKPPLLDDPDTIAQRRELAAEYYRRRNDMIRQQGGFKSKEEEDEELGELMEERDGKLRKVSRFRAARMKP